VTGLAVEILLALAVAAAWLGTAALLVLPTAYDRLHAAGYVGVVTGFFAMLAVIVSDPLSVPSLKAVIIYVALTIGGAVVLHAIGQAIRLREESTDTP
jgi:multisubunit Na+/H+ antiporter MnhG subunit